MDDRHDMAAGFGSAPVLCNDGICSPSLPASGDGASAHDAVERVAKIMREYVDRGVFQELNVDWKEGESAQFDFGWLYAQPYTLLFDPSTNTLQFADLLPRMEQSSMMHTELEAFLKARVDPSLPDHRRVDESLVTLSSGLDDGVLALKLRLNGPHYEYGTRKLINLVHETFLFLNEYWADYMWKNFQVNME
jgi:hypothetical protein